jgi:hypothetical protein
MRTNWIFLSFLVFLLETSMYGQAIIPRITLGLSTPQLHESEYEIVPASAHVKAGAMWRINRWVKSTFHVAYSHYAAGTDRRWSSISPQWELSFQKDSVQQRIVPFVGFARTKHFLGVKSDYAGQDQKIRSRWVQHVFSFGARIALNKHSGLCIAYNRLMPNSIYQTRGRANGNLDLGYYRDLKTISEPTFENKYRRLTFYTTLGFGMYRTVWRDSVYHKDKMLDFHLGLELNKGRRLSYFSSLGIRNGFGLTAGVEWGFCMKGSRRLGVRLGIQRKLTREKNEWLFFPESEEGDVVEKFEWSRGVVLDVNYSLSKNIFVYMSCFQTRFDFSTPQIGLFDHLIGRFLPIQRLNGASAGLRFYMGKGKKNPIPSS